ncbi:MAG: hypothetical protein MJ177_02515 [Clostridia bacterium]|nr:hypothetical protein [Clostridia bacterium]
MKLTINSEITYQTMEGFGASGAWWAQLTGGWTSRESSGMLTKDRIAQLLYSDENGIGMSIYRYNLGAGSSRSGAGDYSNPERRADSFETTGGYDFSRDANAVYMMKKCVEYGADEVIFFVNSPIEALTKNHKAHLDKNKAFRTNLSRKNIPAFCKYCLDVTEHFVKEGLPVSFISPINEPVWKWTGGQEGCHYSVRQAGRVMSRFASELKKRPALNTVQLSGMENGDIRWFNKSFTRRLLKKDIRDSVDGVDVHSYFLNPVKFPGLARTDYLKRYRKWLDRHYPSVKVRCSEWTHMQGGKNCGMDSALVLAKVMFEDISLLNVCSWQHWVACSNVDYCDGIIYIDPEKETYELTKRYYVTGNFSKFIKNGAVRTQVTADDEDVSCLSFINGGKTVVIIINPTQKEKELTLNGQADIYVTDESSDLANYKAEGNIIITPQSVTTLILKN